MASARHRWILIGSILLGATTARAQRDSIASDSITPTTPIHTLSELLTGRVPNALILSYDGSPGAGPAVVLRGLDGPSLFSGPLLVIDGVRASGTTSTDNPIDGGHPGTSRLDDIDPSEIEKIEILPGPAASARFGPDAGNGAILVTLHHGSLMPATGWLSAEGGRIKTPLDWESSFHAWGHTPQGDTILQCQTYQRATGRCVVDSVTHVNVLTGPNNPFRTADEQRYTGGLSAGGHGARIALGGVWDYEPGTLIMQPSQISTFQTAFGRAPSNAQQYPNSFSRGNLHGMVGFDLGKRVDVSGSVAYTGSNQRSANIINLMEDGAFSPGYLGTTEGWPQAFGPAQDFFDTPTQRDVRLTSNVQAHWRPANPLIFHALLGSDAVDQRSADVEDTPGSAPIGTEHFSATDREKHAQYTVDLGAAITAGSAATTYSVLTFGGQYLETHLDDRTDSALNTANGLYSYEYSHFTLPQRTQSAYLDEALTFANRVTIDGGVRWDHQRVHEEHVNATSLNPTINASWVLVGTVADPRLRLRGAFGQTTTLTNPELALAAFHESIFATPRSAPERDRELEGGFDINGKGGQWSLGGTIYARRSINASLPTYANDGFNNFVPTYRPGATISNRGVEMTLSGRLVDKPELKWDATLLASENYNKLLRIGNYQPTDFGGLRDQTGYPLFGVWGTRYTYADSNNDGVIESTEITAQPSESYLGSSTPTHRAALSSTLRMIKGHLRLSTVFDYRGGYVLPDAPAMYRALAGTDRATNESGVPLPEQARDVALLQSVFVPSGFEQRVSALRWRELAATIGPTTGKRFDITLAARNLALWSGYRGGDPDQDYQTLVNSFLPAMHLPQPLTWILRVTAGF